ncbi:MAG: sigma-54-dependent Fis family transcriptional regulator [Gemmatimonadetes bacterium]|jgi:DNA-binding NtrC family response regulator|nr:sigma-54-dependent Fis family transcriptional regulator [Gemmatimonadota bacterium]MBT6147776.1 sigma-54-dependent Fis family transcriptional regulator [Gemmatimonadota bacterium]MBT7859767.1 sigma-54-dependent Fis family transcriptional regulator [Gemmatimonadota bacterium]
MADMTSARLLVVDDEQVVRESLRDWFAEDGYQVETATCGREALEKMEAQPPDVVLLDIKMPGMDGLTVQNKARELAPDAAIIMITAYATVDTAVQALKDGAQDYVTKPIDPDDLAHTVTRTLERRTLQRENARLKKRIEEIAEGDMPEILGDDPAMAEIRRLIATVADTDATVLVQGESGTGKELVARAIHRASPRRHMPLVTVNCAGLPEGLVESELFGHEKGAFTGATYQRKGRLELADGGTLFFDEIGDISPKTQIDLLRVLEEKTVSRVGGNRILPVDFRVVAATHRDLDRAVQDGSFRQDLYYRFNVFNIQLPPLRDRRNDIPMLAAHFLEASARKMGRSAVDFTADAMASLQGHDWPGNVRELENTVERAVVLQQGAHIGADDLPLPTAGTGAIARTTISPSLAEVEHTHIERILRETKGNISQAARVLGIDRVTLYNKIRKYDIQRPASK